MKNRVYNINHEADFNTKVEILARFNKDYGTDYILRNGRVTRISDDGHTHDVWADLPDDNAPAYKVESVIDGVTYCDTVKLLEGAFSLARHAVQKGATSITITEV